MTTRTLPFSRMTVALTGFMGCGKSSVGRELSMLLGIPLVDLDKYIVDKAGKSIPDIFAESGEQGFRDIETEALKEVLGLGGIPLENVLRTPPSNVAEGGTVFRGDTPGTRSLVLSLGGGTILRPENAALIKERCKCFFLRASEETLRLQRTPLYTAAADFIIDIDRLSPMQVAGIIANLIS